MITGLTRIQTLFVRAKGAIPRSPRVTPPITHLTPVMGAMLDTITVIRMQFMRTRGSPADEQIAHVKQAPGQVICFGEGVVKATQVE